MTQYVHYEGDGIMFIVSNAAASFVRSLLYSRLTLVLQSQMIDRQPRVSKSQHNGHHGGRRARSRRGQVAGFYPAPEPDATQVLQIHVHYPLGPITPDVIQVCKAPLVESSIFHEGWYTVTEDFWCRLVLYAH
jgi:hypothetical protein